MITIVTDPSSFENVLKECNVELAREYYSIMESISEDAYCSIQESGILLEATDTGKKVIEEKLQAFVGSAIRMTYKLYDATIAKIKGYVKSVRDDNERKVVEREAAEKERKLSEKVKVFKKKCNDSSRVKDEKAAQEKMVELRQDFSDMSEYAKSEVADLKKKK